MLASKTISIHKALTSLDHILAADDTGAAISIHKALTSLDSSLYTFLFLLPVFQSTRLSRASTERDTLKYQVGVISIHKALTSLDKSPFFVLTCPRGFQSTRLSRASTCFILIVAKWVCLFQSTRLSRASTDVAASIMALKADFNPQGSHEPRQQKYTIILASMPNLYILIIHLQQIIQQVKKFSRILILFSGRLQCESPWNFMCNYYSHQSFLTKNQPSL